jgi:DUF2938 family protein
LATRAGARDAAAGIELGADRRWFWHLRDGQPGLGMGWAAAKTPNPTRVRLLNRAGHTAFGLGPYLTPLVIR